MQPSQDSIPLLVFFMTSFMFTNQARKRNGNKLKNPKKEDPSYESSIVSYDEVIRLRQKYYSSSVSVSYSNSGPLMILGVS